MKIRFSILFGFFIVLTVSMLCISCGSRLKAYPSLVNQGIMPISPSNSYLGTNLFLGEEAAKSRILYQFLKGRGAPGAIEIIEKDYKPARLLLYYPKNIQVYYAELSASDKKYEWIVRGPYSIERNDYRKLVGVEKGNYEAAPIIVDGKTERFVSEPPTPVPTIVIRKPDPTPTIHKKVKPKVIVVAPTKAPESKFEIPKIEIPTARPVMGIPSGPGLNSDQQAIRMAKGLTALSPEGDIIHKVESIDESLDAIAAWYTGDSAKAKAIAEFNSIPAGSALPKGAKIKIPKVLAKTEAAMAKQVKKESDTATPAPVLEHSKEESHSSPDLGTETTTVPNSELATDPQIEAEPTDAHANTEHHEAPLAAKPTIDSKSHAADGHAQESKHEEKVDAKPAEAHGH